MKWLEAREAQAGRFSVETISPACYDSRLGNRTPSPVALSLWGIGFEVGTSGSRLPHQILAAQESDNGDTFRT